MPDKVYVITGPTSGFGRRTALELAKHGTVVLVGRNAAKLDDVRSSIEGRGGKAVSVLCDLSDPTSVRRAVAQITELGLPITGVLNNAGIFPNRPGTNALGWDIAYATNHIGPFVFTETLVPHLQDGTQVVFIVSAVEDPERKAATMSGFRGARYLSAEASTRGEWKPGGSKLPGGDAYATSKQCNLATVLAFARETPRLRFNAIEPGFAPGTNLGRDAGLFLRLLSKYVLSPLSPLIKYWTNPGTAARMITRILTDESDATGVYYDEKGRPMRGSAQVHDPAFNARVVAETRALLGTVHV
ncbi:SDR family NAD(P)-dependent oxidoreductase [Streptomyces lancefieldiae]|uniref:SDR family NAD(P)-dependent oxidoreductase n=1 Tax=Streptomyces lancefieldiae TaxID=3075520 RepID=A0ABU3AXY8_9ACTN|nr:SDR family NAD(P)-dependent oxidoreductase [Streptomyces sp. DSM 40712]MDT0615039.1 SDR family NAD(P)-dependent oxidoreductase [Streptomyces sp. DSM 40712]